MAENTAKFPIPPPAPLSQFPFVDVRQNGRLTPTALRFLQDMWSAIQGSGGVLNLTGWGVTASSSGETTAAAVEGAEQGAQIGSILAATLQARVAQLQDEIEDLRVLLAALGPSPPASDAAAGIDLYYQGDLLGTVTSLDFQGVGVLATADGTVTIPPDSYDWFDPVGDGAHVLLVGPGGAILAWD